MQISLSSLMLAIKAIQRDIARHEEMSNAPDLSDGDADYYGNYVLDLTRALGEVGNAYERSRKTDPDAPTLDELLAGK